MSPGEFSEALQYALGLFDVQIIGFKDATGLIVTPSQVCKYPEMFRPDYHDVMLKKCPPFSNSRSNHKKQYSQSKFEDQLENFERTHQSNLFSPPSPRTPEMNFYPHLQTRRNPDFYQKHHVQDYQQKDSRYRQRQDYQEIDINSLAQDLIYHMPVDNVLNEQMKQRIMSLVHAKDQGIIGALMLYSEDYDFQGFKARIIHKITSTGIRQTVSSKNNLHSTFQYPNTALGGQRKRNAPTQQDRYLQMVHEIEHKGFIDEQTSCILKTLLLEENVMVQQKFNEYLNKQLTHQELSYKVTRLAQHMSAYCERPQSPLPKRKQELMTYVNSLARYHFSDPDDIQLLQKLIHEENEFILSTFDVFDSDQDHENLIDSLQRILDKSKTMGGHLKSVQATSFYKNDESGHWGQQRQHFETHQQRFVQQQRAARPRSPLNGERHLQDFSLYNQANLARTQQFQERPRNQSQQRIIVTRGEMRQDGEFRPTTTVHDVALIPNYFSSGEEDIEQQRLASREGYGPNIYKTPSQTNFQAHLQGNLNANYFYRTPHQIRPEMEELQNEEPMPRQRDQILIRDGEQELFNDQQERPQRKVQQNRSTSQPQARGNYDRYQKQTVEAPRFIVNQEASLRQTLQSATHNSSRSQMEEQKKHKKRKHKKYSSSEQSNSSQTSSSSSESESSRERRKKQKKWRKKNKAKTISVKEINQIVNDQRIAAAMRSDLFIYLQQLLSCEPLDADLLKVFQTYKKNRDGSELLTQLMMTCEDKLLAFFNQTFTDEEIIEIEKLRKSRDAQYITAFADLNKNGDLSALSVFLKLIIQQRKQPSKEELKNILSIALQSRLFSDSDATILEAALESTEGHELQKVLVQYNTHKDYLLLTQQVKQFQLTLPASQIFSNLQQAIKSFAAAEQISQSEAKEALLMVQNNNRNLEAIWTVYELMNDKDDFLESIKVLLQVAGKKVLQSSEIKQSESSSFERSMGSMPAQPTQKQSSSSMFKMMPMESAQDQEYSQSEQVDSPMSESPASSAGRLNILSESQVCDIIQHQHSILRKYAMTGMISYTDAPAFHDLVEKKDYRIVCVFEVFSQNRSEDDFLENLALIAQFIKEQETQANQQRPEITVWEPQDSFILEIDGLAEDKLIQEDQQQWLLTKRKEEDKMIDKVYKAYKTTKDREDFVDSILRLYKKMHVPVTVPKETAVPQINLMSVHSDPFVGEVESLKAQGKFTNVEAEFCLNLISQKDRKLTSIYSAFLRTKDREDFIHTVKRYYAQKQSK